MMIRHTSSITTKGTDAYIVRGRNRAVNAGSKSLEK